MMVVVRSLKLHNASVIHHKYKNSILYADEQVKSAADSRSVVKRLVFKVKFLWPFYNQNKITITLFVSKGSILVLRW